MSTFGVVVKEFYCCGKLKSTTISINNFDKTQVSKDANKDDCCKTTFQYFKVKDKHFASVDFNISQKKPTELFSCFPLYQPTSFFLQNLKVKNSNNTPPIYRGVPIYISICVFRI